jgi:hypothetical protein
MGTVFGSASIELDTIFGNEVGYFRLKRALRVGEKTRKLLGKYGLKPHEVPHRTAVPLLEAASLEDDEGLQDRWAALLANATAQTMDVPPSFANVLRELDPLAATVLDAVYQQIMVSVDIQAHFSIKTEHIRAQLGIDQATFEFHVDNLTRLGVLRAAALPASGAERYEKLAITTFGRAFVRGCRPPGAADPPAQWLTWKP